MIKESDSITKLKGIGGKSAEILNKIGVECVGDILMHLPLRYENFSKPVHVSEDYVGKVISVKGLIASAPLLRRKGNNTILTVTIADQTRALNLAWFHMPYLKNKLKPGLTFIFRGKLIHNRFGYSLEQAKVYDEDDYEQMIGCLWPVYSLTDGITSPKLRVAISDALSELIPDEDFLPIEIQRKYNLMDRTNAIRQMHFPESYDSLIPARRRLVFEEFIMFILAIRSIKSGNKALPNTCKITTHKHADELLLKLPYSLTNAQKKVVSEIWSDINGDFLMNRLIQGDVGSGKTIVALLALISAAENGYQSALMVPTEVLAKQHFDNFKELFNKYNIPYKLELLTGSMTAKEKKEAYERIKSHESHIIVGTHALIQKGVIYDKLGLVVTDEQHRFGVRQREILSEKGSQPHVIVMSATPIPRTLAIILYGDLDISIIDELPANRKPIKNCVVNTSYRQKAYDFIAGQIRIGHQAYVVCPKVDEGEESEGENVIDYAEKLREVLPPYIRVEYLHGRMKSAEKDHIMQEFLTGSINILVSTTVIEVGVDVPNATIMMIEDAERFGLAQLHQLRGRVGRGDAQSYCIFINSSGETEKQKRLEILNNSNDGFVIASEDLKLRGPGDLFGIRQSGEINFAVGDIFSDSSILKDASDGADYIINHMNEYPLLKSKIEKYISENLERLNL